MKASTALEHSRRRWRHPWRWAATLLLLAPAVSGSAVGAGDRVTVEPKETDALLANPGMGWQTFHRFADEDKSLQGLPSSSAYFRFYWRQIEPHDGAIDFAKFDALLARAHRAGQKLAFRVMCTGSGQFLDVPAWLKDQGCQGYDFEYGGARHWVPDFEDPRFQGAHFRLIRELGKRYGNHPDLDLVDIGSVGLWGEWHMSGTKRLGSDQPVPLPSSLTRRAIIDAWRAAFPAKPKVMLIGDVEGLKHAVRNGCGWRADCLGDMGGFSRTWNHMRDLYPLHLRQAGAGEAWKQAPVAFESCWDMQKWKREGWDIRHIFDFALSNHTSYVNNKSAPIPEGTRGEIERLLRQIGYRLVLRKLEHDPKVQPGRTLPVATVWENVGVAPPYGDYRLAWRLAGEGDKAGVTTTTVGSTSIHGWLPGRKKITEPISCPAEFGPGRYRLSIAVVDTSTHSPAVQLAITGRDPDGWYPLSQVEVQSIPP